MSRLLNELRRFAAKLNSSSANGHMGHREESAAYYDNVYSTVSAYHVPYWRSHYYFLWTVIADRLRSRGVQRVLEVGCGSGQLAELLLSQGVTEYVGFDFSEKAIALASEHLKDATFYCDDARTTMLFEQAHFDALICTEVLEHVEDDLKIIARFPQGCSCIFSVPNFPYPSHVRNFKNAQEVVGSIRLLLKNLDVVTFPSPKSDSDVFYLSEGIRSGSVPA